MQNSPTLLESFAPLTDEELVPRILRGSGPAFELLMRRHNQRLFRLARAVLRNDSEAEDVVQEAYVRAYANLASFQGRSRLSTWLTRILLHEALRRRRQKLRAQSMEPERLDRFHESQHETEPAGTESRRETSAVLCEALDALPTKLRAVVMLRLVEGLSTRETASCLRISESDVKVSLHRARGMLAEAIQQRAVDAFRKQFAFANERCDRIVARVFERIVEREGLHHGG